MKSRNLFLGIIIIFVGVVALLSSLDVIDFDWMVAWRLWPMILICIGISILPVKEWLRALLLVLTLAASVLLYRYENENYSRFWFFTQNVAEAQVSQPCS